MCQRDLLIGFVILDQRMIVRGEQRAALESGQRVDNGGSYRRAVVGRRSASCDDEMYIISFI